MSTSIGAGNFADLYDVQIGTLADGHLPQWDATAGRWVNRTADAAGLVDKASAQTIAGVKTFTGGTTTMRGTGASTVSAQCQNSAGTNFARFFTGNGNEGYLEVARLQVGNGNGGLNAWHVNTGADQRMVASGTIRWTTDANNAAGGTPDVGLARNALGQLRVTNGSTGNGSLLASNISIPSTSSLTTNPLIIDSTTGSTEPVFRIYRSGNTTDALACRSNGRWQLLGGISMNSDGDLLLGDTDAKYGMRRGNAQRFQLNDATVGNTFEFDGRSHTNADTRWRCRTSTTDSQAAAQMTVSFAADNAHATRKARVTRFVQDASGAREVGREETDGSRGYLIQPAHATAPADSMLPNSSVNCYAPDTGSLAWKWRDGSGTVRTIALGQPIEGTASGGAVVIPILIGGVQYYLTGRTTYIAS